MKKLIALVLVLMLSLTVVACTQKTDDTVSSEPAEETSTTETTETKETETKESAVPSKITLGYNLDPVGNLNAHMYLPSQFVTQDMVYDGLVYYGENGVIKPALSTEWSKSEDGKTYTFKLREGVKYSDGSDFNAANVVKNFDTIFSDENRGNHSWFPLTNLLESWKSVDDMTFEFTLSKPYSATLYDLAMIRPIRFMADASFPDDGNTANGIKAPIGTGAWMLKEHKKDNYAVFVQNPYYWGEKPAAQEVEIKVIPDSETLALEFEAGNIDFIYGNGLISLDRFNVYKDDPAYVTASSEPMSTRMLLMNTADEIVGDINVRKALSHAIDKENVAKNIFGGIEKPANTIFAPNVPNTQFDLKPYEYNLDKANKMLDDAGWKMGSDGIREKNGKKMSIYFPYISAKITDKSVGEYVQGEWRKIGVDVELKALDEKTYWSNANKGEYDVMFNFSWGAPWDPHSFLMAMTNGSENGGPDYIAQKALPMKKKIDETITAAITEPNEAKMVEDYKYVLTTLHEQAVYIPLTYQAVLSVYRDGEMDGMEFMPEENRLPVWKAVRIK